MFTKFIKKEHVHKWTCVVQIHVAQGPTVSISNKWAGDADEPRTTL